MNESLGKVAFFDIGDTLGMPIFTLHPPQLKALDIFPYVPNELQVLRNFNVRLGIISNTGQDASAAINRILARSGILDYFELELLIYSKDVSLTKNSPEIFKIAAERADHAATPENCLFVGEDKEERTVAQKAGFLVAPHPRLAWEVLTGRPLIYVRIRVPYDQVHQEWRQLLCKFPIVPLYATGHEGRKIYAVTTRQTALKLDDLGFEVDRLGQENDPLERDLFLLRDDSQKSSGFLNMKGEAATLFSRDEDAQFILCSSQEGLVVALPTGYSIDEFHMKEARHGHTHKLLPDMSLLQLPDSVHHRFFTSSLVSLSAAQLAPEEISILDTVTADLIRDHIERYAGIKPIQPNDPEQIVSRHIRHEDNRKATDALELDFQRIGNGKVAISVPSFNHEKSSIL